MTADAEGNDLEKVFIPVTGFLAVQLTGEPTWVDPTEGSATPLVLPEGYVKVGLFKQDGGPQDGGDKEDDLEFFQEGYKLGGIQEPHPAGHARRIQRHRPASSPPARPPTPTA